MGHRGGTSACLSFSEVPGVSQVGAVGDAEQCDRSGAHRRSNPRPQLGLSRSVLGHVSWLDCFNATTPSTTTTCSRDVVQANSIQALTLRLDIKSLSVF